MHIMTAGSLIFALVLLAWGAMALYFRPGNRRRRREQAAWNEMTGRHSHLDRELDRIWRGR